MPSEITPTSCPKACKSEPAVTEADPPPPQTDPQPQQNGGQMMNEQAIVVGGIGIGIGQAAANGQQQNVEPPQTVKCDLCGGHFKNKRGLGIHKASKHAVWSPRRKEAKLPPAAAAEVKMEQHQMIPHLAYQTSKTMPTGKIINRAVTANSAQIGGGGDLPCSSTSCRTPNLPTPDPDQDQYLEIIGVVNGKPDVGAAAGGLHRATMDAQHTVSNVVNACAARCQSTMVFEGVKTGDGGKIDKITIEFKCNECRGKRGIVRCSRGRPCCVSCCGHERCK